MIFYKKLLKKNIKTTFNAISCDGDTSTNDMVSIFSTAKAKNNYIIKNINEKKIKDFDQRITCSSFKSSKKSSCRWRRSNSKFITINVKKAPRQLMKRQKKFAFSIANSPLVKTAIAGE